MKDKIVHISDVHIRFGSRHEEYDIVFDRTIESVKKIKPRRIVITGDLFHIKINLSPNAITIAGKFLKELSKIAPVDVSPGNHDWNSQSPGQGNSITPIVELIENGYIVTKEIKTIPVPKEGNGIYFYRDSGFYNIDNEIVYGIYSCFDNEILTLTKKEKDKKYIALFHGPINGCIGDNGYEMKGDEIINLSIFNNFDMVMLGDIHEHQSFALKGSEVDNVAFSGSLVQQGYGEDISKGYLIWNIEKNTFERILIPNDYGFSKLNISAGENIEQRIREMPLSFDKTKTKVSIEYEDYEENYSVELIKQIEHTVKKIHGCRSVDVSWNSITREVENKEIKIEEIDYKNTEQFKDLLIKFLEEKEFEDIDDVIELSKEIDSKLSFPKDSSKGIRWEPIKMVVNNLFMFPEEDVVFDFEKRKGITGIMGENYCGKSNSIKALVWILYKKMLGGGKSDKLVNLYTKSNEGYGKFYLRISGEEYCIERGVIVKHKKDGTSDVSYKINYTKKVGDKWVKEDSDESATQKKDAEKVISEAIGSFEDFITVTLQSQSSSGSSSGGYLTLSQQPKNDLVNKYLGLEPFRDRYTVGNNTFNKVKATQKALGDPIELEEKIKTEEESIEKETKELNGFEKEKIEVYDEIEKCNKEIIKETKKLINIENLSETDENIINQKIKLEKEEKEKEEKQIPDIKIWLKSNFKKEAPKPSTNLNKRQIETELNTKREKFQKDKDDYNKTEKWINENKKKEKVDTKPIEEKISEIGVALSKLNDKLTISKGEKCPTCGHVKQVANPEVEKDCIEKIKRGKEALEIQKNLLKDANEIDEYNNKIDKKTNELTALTNSLTKLKQDIDKLKEDLELDTKISEILKHNEEVENKSTKFDDLKETVKNREEQIKYLNEQLELLNKNKDALEKNKKINEKIKEIENDIKAYKTQNLQLDEKIKELSSSISVSKNNIENYSEKLKTIRNSEKIYKKYSIYLQAVHRDGIPALIIKQKLPIVNHRINNLLKNIVDFKIELSVNKNGDIEEMFYFGNDKERSLPLSMSSGSQGFLGSIAIQDALHFVSKLPKPSLCMIDEGFGSLDEKHTMDISVIFSYFKNRYRNTIIITHRNEIKDFVDNIIQVSKTTKGLTEEQLKENKHAGISVYDMN